MLMTANATDLSAKLLAVENISVRRARTQTASFDIVSRVLTLPLWKDMSPVVEQMLVGHEVGHALYTSQDYIKPIEENPKIQGYLNVLEDVRIEKLMKRKYPGIRKTMSQGYKELNDKDFFGVAKSDFDKLLLIDRINLYFKAGYSCGVKFSAEEKQFVTRAERTETVDEVITLAKEVFEFSKEELEKKIREQELMKLTMPNETDFGDPDDLDEMDEDSEMMDPSSYEDSDETSEEDTAFESAENDKTSGGKKESFEETVERRLNDEIESATDRAFYKKLEESADQNTEYMSYTLDTEYPFDVIVPFKQVLQETNHEFYDQEKFAEYQKFKTETSRVVNYLVKEFEMRKSAKLYKRATTSKVGTLDMRKVWSYKLNDDLFKRVTTVAQGKNHGMVFLLDWSGSMDNCLAETIEQVISLAMFCQRVQIPYQVLAFSSQYSLYDIYRYDSVNDPEAMKKYEAMREKRRALGESTSVLNNAASDFALLEFFSSKMTNLEFNTMAARMLQVWKFKQSKHNMYQTSGTPLNEALAYMMKHIPMFQSQNNVEKMTLITLTDGEGSGLYTNSRYSLDDYRTETRDGKYNRINQKHFLLDPETKKSYPISRMGQHQTESLLRMMKDKFDITIVGFFVCENSRNRLCGAINSNIPGFKGDMHQKIEDIRKDFRTNGFYSITNSGRDDLFLIPRSSLRIEDSVLVVNDKLTVKQIAKQFSKSFSSRKTSRVLLNRFIGYVA